MSKARLPSNYWKLWSASLISNIGNGVSAIALPWLASALTRSPLTIAVVGIMGQLPWLIFSLPAGVITDRFDRRRIIIATDITRGVVTALGALVIYLNRGSFSHIKDPTHAFQGSPNLLLATLMICGFILGSAEILGNNSVQTLMPDVVETELLQKANGQMWSIESITNQFLGPALGSLLLGFSIYLPFFVDATSFFASAGLTALVVVQVREIVKKKEVIASKQSAVVSFGQELKEGFTWLMQHPLLRSMAFTLGGLNFVSQIAFSTNILFAQEVLHTNIFTFAILGTAGAFGGLFGGVVGPRVVKKLGDGRSIVVALVGMPLATSIGFFVRSWYIFYLIIFIEVFFGLLWNLVTVSFRQTIIPSGLLGRVNSGYRFFGLGFMSIGGLIGGLLVTLSEHFVSREIALRLPLLVAGGIGLLIWALVRKRLTSEALESARELAQAARTGSAS